MNLADRFYDNLKQINFFLPKIKEKEIILFVRQFSTMLNAGLPLLKCLAILHSQQNNLAFKIKINKIKESVESGYSLSFSLRKFPKVFNQLFVNIIDAGEKGGVLDIILNRLSLYMEKMAKLKKQLRRAMIYPLITILVGFIVVSILFVFVIPVFSRMFIDFDKALPLPTLIVINLSEFIIVNLQYIIGCIVAAVFLIRQLYSSKKGRVLFDKMLLKLPIIGELIKKIAVARFVRTTGTMLASGVAILDALKVVARISTNKVVEFAVLDVRKLISHGWTIADSLEQSSIFCDMVCSMVAVGEETGEIVDMMEKIADFHDEEIDQTILNLTTMIEPLMLIFMGLVVGGLVVSMYLPIFTMAVVMQ